MSDIHWCHANTHRDHAFDGHDKGGVSYCGEVVHPGEIKLYGLLGDSKCKACRDIIARQESK